MNRYRPLAALAALLAAALWVAVPAAPAAAHTDLKSTVPAAKSTTSKPVTEVTLTFTGLIKKPGTSVDVTGPDGTSHSVGDAGVLDRTITQKVDALAVGVITVAWRTYASDGHELRGSFTFTNKVAPPSPSAEPSPGQTPGPSGAPAATPPATTAAASPVSDEDSSSSVVWWIAGVAVLLIAGTGGLLWRRRRGAGAA